MHLPRFSETWQVGLPTVKHLPELTPSRIVITYLLPYRISMVHVESLHVASKYHCCCCPWPVEALGRRSYCKHDMILNYKPAY